MLGHEELHSNADCLYGVRSVTLSAYGFSGNSLRAKHCSSRFVFRQGVSLGERCRSTALRTKKREEVRSAMHERWFWWRG